LKENQESKKSSTLRPYHEGAEPAAGADQTRWRSPGSTALTLDINMSILNNAKEIADLIKKYNDQELYAKIVSLREEIIEIREENIELKEELKKFKKSQEVSTNLVREGNCYFLKSDKKKENPLCMACWDADRKLVNLIVQKTRQGKTIKCDICQSR
jgi:hypothetical protein